MYFTHNYITYDTPRYLTIGNNSLINNIDPIITPDNYDSIFKKEIILAGYDPANLQVEAVLNIEGYYDVKIMNQSNKKCLYTIGRMSSKWDMSSISVKWTFGILSISIPVKKPANDVEKIIINVVSSDIDNDQL